MKMLWITLLTLLVPDQDFALGLPFRVPDLATVSNAGPWAEEQVFSEVCGTLEMLCTVVPVRRRQGRCQNDGVYWRINSPPLYKDCYWGVSSEFLLWWSQTCFQNIPLCIISTGLTCCNGVNICPFLFFTPNFNSCFFPQQAFLSLLVVFHSLMQGCQTQFGSGATYRSGDHCNHNILTYK